ncbi:hypothetical protein BCR34DRAFT_461395, partial [Clohesyomyces aquaticus]
EIIAVSLKQNPAFSALSYPWGASKQDQEIELNGSSFYISGSLLDAILQFQVEDDSSQKLFWVDAVCVSQ